jgi:hypothetical protein
LCIHSIVGFEERPRVGEQRTVGRMIKRLDRRYARHELRVLVFDMLRKLMLGVRWPGDQNLAGSRQGSNNFMEECLILRGVTAADGVRLMVDVPRRMLRMHHNPIGLIHVEVKYTRFVVINPDNRMKVLGHGNSSCAGSLDA